MKKILNVAISALVVLSFVACNNNDNTEEVVSLAALKIDSVRIEKDTMQSFSIQRIVTFSNYVQGCEGFYGYDYKGEDKNRFVTTIKAKTNGTCGSEIVGNTSFNFQPQTSGTYLFKFWQGKDASNKDVWLEKSIVVK